MLTAIVMINANVARIPEVGQAIAALESVKSVYSTTGGVDLVALVEVDEYDMLADVISDRIGKIPGVQSINTHLAFRTFSHEDMEAAFDIGLD